MTLPPLHRTLELCGFAALPALHSEAYNGWLLRLSGGGPKRANSVNLLDPSTLPLEQKIDRCELLFRQQGVPPTFRLTQHEIDPGLDALLAARGYRKHDESIVMLRSLAAPASPDSLGEDANAVAQLPAEQWFALLHEIDQGNAERKRKHVELLGRLALPALYGAIERAERRVAMGLAVIDARHAGLFDIATLPEARRQGHARRLTRALLLGAQRRGAEFAYLQVAAENRAAIWLYAALGFEECYRYWYRVLDGRS